MPIIYFNDQTGYYVVKFAEFIGFQEIDTRWMYDPDLGWRARIVNVDVLRDGENTWKFGTFEDAVKKCKELWQEVKTV